MNHTISASEPATHEVIVFTDGSVKDDVWGGCAWATEDFARNSGFFGRSYALGSVGKDEVPTAELQGMRYALEYLVEREDDANGVGTYIKIITDCREALNMLITVMDIGVFDTRREPVLRQIMALLKRLRKRGVGVYIGWRRRCTEPGNRFADDWAWLAAEHSRRGKVGLMGRHGNSQGKHLEAGAKNWRGQVTDL